MYKNIINNVLVILEFHTKYLFTKSTRQYEQTNQFKIVVLKIG